MTPPFAHIQESLRTLQAAEMPESDWLQVNEVLRAWTQSIDAGDETGTARALMELEPWTSTRRVNRGVDPGLDQTPTCPASDYSSDLLTRLIHHFGLDRPSDNGGTERDPAD
jgi:hypothetical protein